MIEKQAFKETEQGDALLSDFYQNKLQDDNSVINKDELTVDDVEECGLLDDCYNCYLDNACDLRDIAKDIIDRI